MKYDNVLLFTSVFEVTAINKKLNDKAISFEINFGPIISKKTHPEGPGRNKTSALHPKSLDKGNWYLPYTQEKPSLSILSAWPDFRKRMYNANLIDKIAQKMVKYWL